MISVLFALWLVWFTGGLILFLAGMGPQAAGDPRMFELGGRLMFSAIGVAVVAGIGSIVFFLITQQPLDKLAGH